LPTIHPERLPQHLSASLIVSVNPIEVAYWKSISLKVRLPIAPCQWEVVTGKIAPAANLGKTLEGEREGALSFYWTSQFIDDHPEIGLAYRRWKNIVTLVRVPLGNLCEIIHHASGSAKRRVNIHGSEESRPNLFYFSLPHSHSSREARWRFQMKQSKGAIRYLERVFARICCAVFFL